VSKRFPSGWPEELALKASVPMSRKRKRAIAGNCCKSLIDTLAWYGFDPLGIRAEGKNPSRREMPAGLRGRTASLDPFLVARMLDEDRI
jgi:hypothetical protein